MKKFVCFLSLALILLLSIELTNAADESTSGCVVHIKRFACINKEEESYKKCNGLQECDKFENDVLSEDRCRLIASYNCENTRIEITHSKIVTARFNGVQLTSLEGNLDFCLNYIWREREFGRCQKGE